MKRREFMKLVSGTAATWPLVARPEHTPVVRRGRVAETGLPGPA